MEVKPIGYINSLFTFKNGTPRQPSVCPFARGSLEVEKSIFTNPDHSLEGLEEFSHVWLIFVFHKNNTQYVKAKVKPPRLNGKRVGLFSTRSPYRPNAIGLSLAKLDSVEGNTLHLSGIDLLDGTPILDIKPYIPQYDSPIISTKSSLSNESHCSTEEDIKEESDCALKKLEDSDLSSEVKQEEKEIKSELNEYTEESSEQRCHNITYVKGPLSDFETEKQICDSQSDSNETPGVTNSARKTDIKSAKWISEAPISKLDVTITERAKSQLQKFSKLAENPDFRLKFLHSAEEALEAIKAILSEDPRSIYRRQKCEDSLYYFTVDVLHVTCWFDDDVVEVVKVQPVLYAEHLKAS
uniref:tRNA (Adenine(37)-N6)-methyltransferase-like n=1 Tax=Crassostrea virginica TaxID=6565 RepID=A0A8B8DYK0_CRAVI|nr:tRNA (adenine(37)-N6)-methyltransferase-like [Crassostrea virginica]XP_022332663.1 tRNA (adenine(37)-N6)-methyltransferase-like [Crassostrea virginica]